MYPGGDLLCGGLAGAVRTEQGDDLAGKSTTQKVASGVHPASSGRLRYAGKDVTGISARDAARAGVCLIPEGRGIFPNLTVRENLWMMTFTGKSREEIETDAYQRFPILAQRAKQTAGTMSGGEQQMLALSRGLACDPAVLLLDELSMGLAPLIVEQLYGQVAELARTGVAVLVVEQFATAVLDMADRAAVLVRGKVVYDGPPGRALTDELANLYLGSST